jgi:hypothetical protein
MNFTVFALGVATCIACVLLHHPQILPLAIIFTIAGPIFAKKE